MSDTPVTQITAMATRVLGGMLKVSARGFGCMNVAYAYGLRKTKREAKK